MNSLSKKCQEAKEKYDACFNNWFSERFLKGVNEDECQSLFKIYQKCVKVNLYFHFSLKFEYKKIFNLLFKEAIEEQKIELWNLPSEYEPNKSKYSSTYEPHKQPKSDDSKKQAK